MKKEIPARTTSATIAMKIAVLPLKLLPVEDVLGVVMIVGVVVVGTCDGDCGIPGEKGLPGWARAEEGAIIAASRVIARRRRTTVPTRAAAPWPASRAGRGRAARSPRPPRGRRSLR